MRYHGIKISSTGCYQVLRRLGLNRLSTISQLPEYTDEVDLREKLAAWEESYDVYRPHSGLKRKTPCETLEEKLPS